MKKNVTFIMATFILSTVVSCGYIGGLTHKVFSFSSLEEMTSFYHAGPYNIETDYIMFDTSSLIEGERDYFVDGVIENKTNKYRPTYFCEHNKLPFHYGLSPSSTSFDSKCDYYLAFLERKTNSLENLKWVSRKITSYANEESYSSSGNEERLGYVLLSNDVKVLEIKFHGVPNESYEYYDEEACNLLYQKIEEIKNIVKDLCIEAYAEYSE